MKRRRCSLLRKASASSGFCKPKLLHPPLRTIRRQKSLRFQSLAFALSAERSAELCSQNLVRTEQPVSVVVLAVFAAQLSELECQAVPV